MERPIVSLDLNRYAAFAIHVKGRRMRQVQSAWWSIVVVALCLALPAAAAEPDLEGRELAGTRLVVGTRERPPFAMKNADGTWSGIAIDLWRSIAGQLGVSYELRERDRDGLIRGIQDGSLDVVVDAIATTVELERVVDFTQPYYTTGLGIAVPRRIGSDWMGALRHVLSTDLLRLLIIIAVATLLVGVLMWLMERKRNVPHFGGRVAEGIGSALWWSATTMTTVGYGDKAPITAAGRIIAVVWMLMGIVLISGVTATITTALTVHRLGSRVHGPEDLAGSWVATIPGTAAEAYLKNRHIAFKPYATVSAGLHAVVRHQVDAMVYDAPILRYAVRTEMDGTIQVLRGTFDHDDYGLIIPQGSPLREPMNRALLTVIREPGWEELLRSYLGEY
jgi:polar amino acid transport system substrate-binding protein